ncbi:MAG: hypothetical protein C3F02_04265 [Parcubacteria group bacterium]|nr:MAG: hypothetical protein C3F02_04265 [Parcubacteria group bacterium]
MKKSLKIHQNNQPLSAQLARVETSVSLLKNEVGALRKHVDVSLASTKNDLKDYADQRLVQLENRLDKKIERKMEDMLASHHNSLLDAISEVVINDRIKPLELRVGILESRKI